VPPTAGLHGRAHRLRRRLARLRARAEQRRSYRRPRRAGPRRRADEPRDAVDHHRDLPAAPARHGHRHLGGGLFASAVDPAAGRRAAHRARDLEVDLLHQRPGRARRARAAPVLIAESRDTSAGQRLDLPGLATSGIGLFALTYGFIEANTYGWASAQI